VLRTLTVVFSVTKITITIGVGDVTVVIEIPIPDRLAATFTV
jgi:hypothetical protein